MIHSEYWKTGIYIYTLRRHIHIFIYIYTYILDELSLYIYLLRVSPNLEEVETVAKLWLANKGLLNLLCSVYLYILYGKYGIMKQSEKKSRNLLPVSI